MLYIYEITDKKLWDDFVTSQQNHTFLHSWAWGEFNEAMGDKIWRFGAYSSPTGSDPVGLLSVALVIKVHAKRGNFLFVPHGPIIKPAGSDPDFTGVRPRHIMEVLIAKLREIANQEKVSFIRISPILEESEENRNLFNKRGFRPAPIHMHAETTWTLDLSPSEDELLMGMRKTTRNLIRRAMKEKVHVVIGSSERDLAIFNGLYMETVKKHHFAPFPLTYLKNQVKVLSGDNRIKVFTAWYNNECLAAAIVVFYGNSAFYHHGASIASKIPAAYLLQWEAIREAKRRGHKFYNFWGIIKEGTPANHPWRGITLFKKGFGGFQTNYMHAQDMPISWKYWANYIFEALRRMSRRL